jgi:hypothetical protein
MKGRVMNYVRESLELWGCGECEGSDAHGGQGAMTFDRKQVLYRNQEFG